MRWLELAPFLRLRFLAFYNVKDDFLNEILFNLFDEIFVILEQRDEQLCLSDLWHISKFYENVHIS